MNDLISRKAAIDKFIDGLEEIFADLRERHVDDSVCGLCEYDGAYMGESGDWCNECPGFERDDCFKLSDKIRKEWTDEIIKTLQSAQPEPLSDAYTKAVWTWLLDYQIKAAELKGRYTPYEVLSWVANDWRKEHENEPVGCSGCKYDWFGDPRCNRCARAFQDYYEADMRGEHDD